jgi:hypothetical protein
MGNHFCIGIGGEFSALSLQFFAKLAKVFDYAVVHDRKPIGRVGMGIGLRRPPMSRPARVPNAQRTIERLSCELGFEIAELALCSPTLNLPAFKSRNPCRIVAAIFQPLKGIDEMLGDRLAPEDADNSAHQGASLALVSTDDISPLYTAPE